MSTADLTAHPRPVVEGLFTAGGEPRLQGSRCAGCGAVYFPVALSCRNPGCAAKSIEAALLPNRGRLLSYTVQRYQPPALFQMDDWEPYAIGLVDLGDGVEVMGMLDNIALDQIAIGSAVRLAISHLYTDADGRSVQTYKFAPDSAGGDS